MRIIATLLGGAAMVLFGMALAFGLYFVSVALAVWLLAFALDAVTFTWTLALKVALAIWAASILLNLVMPRRAQ